MKHRSLLTAVQWVHALLDSEFEVQVMPRGFPGRIKMPPGWNARSETEGDHLFYFVASGGFSAQIEDRNLSMKQGELLWLSPGVAFRFRLPEGQSLTAYRLRLLTKKRKEAQTSCQVFKAAWPCQPWLDYLADETSQIAQLRGERIRGLLLCFFTELARIEGSSGNEPSGLTKAQREAILEYFIHHVREWPSPRNLAAHLQLSSSYFAKQFRKSFGQPPRHWLMEQRIRLAGSRLLESELNISQVADEFGYENLFLFSRQFKQVFGVSPQQHRRQKVTGLARL